MNKKFLLSLLSNLLIMCLLWPLNLATCILYCVQGVYNLRAYSIVGPLKNSAHNALWLALARSLASFYIEMIFTETRRFCYIFNWQSPWFLLSKKISGGNVNVMFIEFFLSFLVAKLLYKSKWPSVCQPRLGENVIFSAPNWDIAPFFFVQIPLINEHLF